MKNSHYPPKKKSPVIGHGKPKKGSEGFLIAAHSKQTSAGSKTYIAFRKHVMG